MSFRSQICSSLSQHSTSFFCTLVSRRMPPPPPPPTCAIAMITNEPTDERVDRATWAMCAVMRRKFGWYTGVCSGYDGWFDLKAMTKEIGGPLHVLRDASGRLDEAAWADYDVTYDRVRVRPPVTFWPSSMPSMQPPDMHRGADLNKWMLFFPILLKLSKLYRQCDAWAKGTAATFPEMEVDAALWSARAAGIPESVPMYLAVRGRQAEWWMYNGRGPSAFEISNDHNKIKRRRGNSASSSTASSSTASTNSLVDVALVFDAMAVYEW